MTINVNLELFLNYKMLSNKQFAVPYKVESPIFWLVPVNF